MSQEELDPGAKAYEPCEHQLLTPHSLTLCLLLAHLLSLTEPASACVASYCLQAP